MKILDKLVSKIAVLFLICVSVVFILLPFNIVEIFSSKNIIGFINTIKGNYLYSLGGVIILILGLKSLLSGVFSRAGRQNHIVTHMNFGDLKISDEAIEGLTESTISKIVGIRSTKILVDFMEGYISIKIKGQVAPEVNIPEVTAEIQTSVKDTIEKHTGIPVSQVNVDILSISSPMKSLK